ncbi:hypothetical protein AMTR_s00013p00159980 [Amborella trichopoda]|uniref:Uncharacterized protein n=1 Tax=Amborella trichopoda TaxID=13333 RepID=W1PQB0_AMBTC|nr:hypothetical protein AMTR_s00013p00159980 [Amborella trichopoda]
MATGTVPPSLSSLKRSNCRLSFSNGVGYAKIRVTCNLQRIRSRKNRVLVMKNFGSETVELQPVSDGSPLPGGWFFKATFILLSFIALVLLLWVYSLGWFSIFVK